MAKVRRAYGDTFSRRVANGLSTANGGSALVVRLFCVLCCLAFVLSASTVYLAGEAEAATIINQAQATYTISGQEQVYNSNQDMITANLQGTTAAITFYRYAGGTQPDMTINVSPTSYSVSSNQAGPFAQLPVPVAPGYPALNLSNLKLQQTDFYHAGGPIFIVVTDMNHNIRPNLAETIIIEMTSSTGDKEILRLVETGEDTGVYAGYIQSASPSAGAAANYDGKLAVTEASQIVARYQDSWNQSETLIAAALVDPTGRIFDSLTGQPINGATVTLIDTSTGNPATVIGDDGASSFPATIISGGTATDSGGSVYSFPPGTYRFPLVATGNYRLETTPPTTHKGPSTVPDSTLQNLPGAPYILSPASRGGLFVVNPGPIVRIDVPLDPLLTGLWMEKFAGKATAAIGDFVPFRMKVANGDATHPAVTVVVTDRLPHGLRYIKGSLRIAGVVAADPVISADGMTLRIPLGDMAQTESKEMTYVTQVTAGARTGARLTNTAYAEGIAVISNPAQASVTISEDFFSSRTFLMGTVTSGECGSDGAGVEGIRIYLENGTYVISDKKGMFHFEGVRPGTHVVQLDIDSLPDGYEVARCEDNSRFAGRSYSQFVDLQGGALWRVDFHVRSKDEPPAEPASLLKQPEPAAQVPAPAALPPRNEAVLELANTIEGKNIVYRVSMHGTALPVQATHLKVILPEGVVYEPGSSKMDGIPVADPSLKNKKNLAYQLGALPESWRHEFTFRGYPTREIMSGTLITQAYLSADGAKGTRVLTPPAETSLQLVKDSTVRPMPEIVLHPHFDSFGSELGNDDRQNLDELARLLISLRADKIHVTGHTDNKRIARRSRSIHKDNRALSMARARQVGHYLMEKLHLPPEKLSLDGRGETSPIADNRTKAGRAMNRRVEVKVTSNLVISNAQMSVLKEFSGEQRADSAELANEPETGLDDTSQAESPDSATDVADAQTAVAPERSDDAKGIIRTGKSTPDTTKIPAKRSSGTSAAGKTGPSPAKASATGKGAGKSAEDAPQIEKSPIPRGGSAALEKSDMEDAAGEEKEGELVVIPPQAETSAAPPSPDESSQDDEQLPEFSMAWIETVQPGREWVWPPPVYYPSMPSTHIAIKHHPADKVKVSVNGEEVSPILLEKILKHPNGSVTVTYWRGIHLLDGDNRIVAIITPTDNSEPVTLDRILHVSTSPVRAELVPELSHLTADGKKPPVIALRMFDKDDYPIREGMTGTFSITAPYESYVDPEKAKLNDLVVKSETKYIIGKEGVALIMLQPTNRTGEVIVTIPYANNREEPYRAWLTPQKREWILVGLAEGTAGYNTASGHMENLRASGAEETYYKDGKVAFFAKGTIKGEWLLTMAYDSEKTSVIPGSSLFQTINPNSYYTLYGDNSQQQYDAASARKLFLKIERSQFYALFGDYNTGLTLTELSRYSRSLNGIKSEYQGKNYEFNVFASETGQSFTKDEIRGEGTSGLYHLSRKNIVLNSDKITIEVRDRFRSEVIISTRTLARYMEYSIDYDAGTILFKEPIPSRDETFNPYYIVVDYETRDVGKESLNYGGRAGIKFLDEKVKTGVTYIHEDQLVGTGNSYGLDAMWQVATGTKLKAEVTRTGTSFSGVKRDASAWLAEAEHRSPKLDGKIYYRELEQGFGLGQQSASEAGTRKAGAEGLYRMSDALTMNGQLYRQYNLATGGERDLIEGKTSYTYKDYATRLGLRHVSDSVGDGTVKTSDQLTMGGSWLTLNKKLAFHLDHDQSIGGNNSTDFPTRTTFGSDLKVTDKTTVFVQQEFTAGSGATSNSTRIGMKSSPWEGGAFNSSMEQNMRENGDRLFALFGLKQNWKMTDKFSLDAALDRSQTISKSVNYSQSTQGSISSVTTSDQFTAVSVGTSYIEKQWNWNSRIEYRTAAAEDKRGVQTSFVGDLHEGWGGSARFQLFDSQTSVGFNKTNADLRLGLVYRPPRTKWIVLDRLDLLFDRQEGASSNLESRRIVNNLAVNYKPDRATQLSIQYGAKYSLETIDNSNYHSYTDLIGVEGRYDLTKKWDIGMKGSLLHTWNSGMMSYSTGPSVGYNIMENAWISVGYNVVGFTDKDFSAADYTARGPYVRFRIKFDQNSVKDAAGWLNKQ